MHKLALKNRWNISFPYEILSHAALCDKCDILGVNLTWLSKGWQSKFSSYENKQLTFWKRCLLLPQPSNVSSSTLVYYNTDCSFLREIILLYFFFKGKIHLFTFSQDLAHQTLGKKVNKSVPGPTMFITCMMYACKCWTIPLMIQYIIACWHCNGYTNSVFIFYPGTIIAVQTIKYPSFLFSVSWKQYIYGTFLVWKGPRATFFEILKGIPSSQCSACT